MTYRQPLAQISNKGASFLTSSEFPQCFSKAYALKATIHTCSADITIGTETWLSDEIANKHLTILSTFEIFRKDRGGVLITVEDDYRTSLIDVDSH